MKKIFLPLLFLTAVDQTTLAQTILLEQDVNADTILPTFGPNYKNFTYSYIRYGFVAGNSEGKGADIIYGLSSDFSVGIRYKRKISNFCSLGFEIDYGSVNYHLKQNDSKTLPDTIRHNRKEKLVYNNLGFGLYNRFNFGKRGNILGNYLDLGGYGEWGAGIKHFYKDKLDDWEQEQTGAKIRKVTNKSLLYANSLNYGATARFGINRYVLYGKYRISNLFKEKFDYPELPRLIVGVEIGFTK